jgi:predicted TIM-barrel fold metal-dependent hydrolase
MGYVDSHTHLWFPEALDAQVRERVYSITNVFHTPSPAETVAEMDRLDLDYVGIMAYPSRELWGTREDFPIRLLRLCANYPDRFAVFGGIDVRALAPQEVVREMEHQYEAGVSGFKLHPPHMWVKPNAYREEEGGLRQLELLYQFASDHKLPVVIHTGTSSFPRARNKYGDPVYVDDVSVDFPRLLVVMAHAGRPNWVQTAFQLVRIRSNVYTDISGIPPQRLFDYLPRIEDISVKVLYGSDFGSPGVKSLEDNLKAVVALPLSTEVKMTILEGVPKRIMKPLAK